MAEQLATAPEQEAAEHAATVAGSRWSILAKLRVVLFVVVVIAVECVVAYVCIPSPSQTAAMAGVVPATGREADAMLPAEEQADAAREDQMEVDLGEFHVVSYQPASNTTLRIDFHMYGAIRSDDEGKFQEAWKENTHRLRDQVIMTVRGCELSELTDAGLGLIKRKILEKTNRTLGKPLLQAVIFSEFSFIEQ
jgi:flagellar FliL protein